MKQRPVLLAVVVMLAMLGIASAGCNPTYVRRAGNTIWVLPTGADDTDNLKCAFGEATQRRDVTLHLLKGTYTTGRIVVDGFVGTIRGAGIDATIIRNPEEAIYVTSDDFYMVAAESPSYAPPSLFVFLGGDYNVTELTFSIVGQEPATDWSIFGIRDWLGHGLRSMAAAVVILGKDSGNGYREADAFFHRVKIEGEVSNDPLFGLNLINGFFYEGFAGPDPLPLKGTFTVVDSSFENVGSPNPVVNVVDSRIMITGNVYQNHGPSGMNTVGGEFVDGKDSLYVYAHNQVVGSTYGIQLYDDCLGGTANCGTSGSSLIVKNNHFSTTEGAWFDSTFLNGTNALVLGNNFSDVNDVAVYLGENTSHCTVIGAGNATVIDLGTDNTIKGPARHGGPRHGASLMKRWKRR